MKELLIEMISTPLGVISTIVMSAVFCETVPASPVHLENAFRQIYTDKGNFGNVYFFPL
ncbi:hypothetical protein [Yoonia vestfoldensis]|jgi:hypothetical protein|uniref:Uncharacterized protein n=1 Tax=Yoonia vestfoldensis TaxID=245188 RepID=A0A1Y0EEA4_9RHOB|nr:hypothetical protein [Yoonia vestfoldensis]ARU01602.1 hypothetical protein LOKVESSMR4R_02297 [Yoonia vestfoldensis]